MRTLMAAGGDRHVIYVSIVGVDRHPFAYYRTKLEAERMLEQSGRHWTIQRATQFHDLVDRFLTLPVSAKTSHLRFQPVATDDVSARLAELVAAGPSGRAPDFGEPDPGQDHGQAGPVDPVTPDRVGQGVRPGGSLGARPPVGLADMGSVAEGALGSDLTLVVPFRRAPYAGQCKTDASP
jgi:hypothetical protein